MLKPQDVVVLVKLALERGRSWTYKQLAYELSMSVSEVYAGVKRSTQACLFSKELNRPNRKSLEEFLIHGVKYAFFPTVGPITRGIPTSFSSPMLSNKFVNEDNDVIFVWPHPSGHRRGQELTPLYKSVPDACMRDNNLYNALSVLDAIRIGRARDKNIAERLLLEMIRGDK